MYQMDVDINNVKNKMQLRMNNDEGSMEADSHRWVRAMSTEDLSFIKRFILASGSLKALAAEYGISYPTVRLRLDRLIERIRIHDDEQIQSDFERHLRVLVAEGQLDTTIMRALLRAHRREIQKMKENPS